jgi:hypothetical protein
MALQIMVSPTMSKANPKGIGRTKIGSPSATITTPQTNRIQLGIVCNRQHNRFMYGVQQARLAFLFRMLRNLISTNIIPYCLIDIRTGLFFWFDRGLDT